MEVSVLEKGKGKKGKGGDKHKEKEKGFANKGKGKGNFLKRAKGSLRKDNRRVTATATTVVTMVDNRRRLSLMLMFAPSAASMDTGRRTAERSRPTSRIRSELLKPQTMITSNKAPSPQLRSLAVVLTLRQFVWCLCMLHMLVQQLSKISQCIHVPRLQHVLVMFECCKNVFAVRLTW